jgi:membrane-bound lytic murein transglycosylase B
VAPELTFRARLATELADYLPPDSLGLLVRDERELSPIALADATIRVLTPRALEAAGAEQASARLRELPALTGAETARQLMPALERIGRLTGAPSDLIRASSQVAASVIRLESSGGTVQGESQLVAAVVRLAYAAVRAGVPAAEVVAALATPPFPRSLGGTDPVPADG